MNIENSTPIKVENATVEFVKGTMGPITTYLFDTTKGGHPMVNAMAGLAILKENEQLIMLNHCPPSGLYPKIADEFDYIDHELPNGVTQIVFSKKSNATNITDFSATSCSGGCG
ncbi:hypothetical protein GSY74_00530 [Sulfurovum sp. bin170]|uniref:hypothetical protein n=1 Tax=Sulfurovum sp. bin170 TaxID=2695268 RepID=UPI0013DECAE9|nr:hypothetical protein [Sulfurovum sp. bin170]NEW59756.1 hypothetical protein [Sulfurovum sp. bin170]